MSKSIAVKCIRNDSKTLPFAVNGVYNAEDIGGQYKISFYKGANDNGTNFIHAPLNGHYLEFIPVDIQK